MSQELEVTDDLVGSAESEAPPQGDRRRPRLPVLAVLLVVSLVVAGGVGYLLGVPASPPSDDSVEAGFARDMQAHHAQAVEMSLIVREKSSDPNIRAMAYDVITSQQQQIGQMYAWLDGWGLPQTSNRAPMAWMAGVDHSGPNAMPSGSMKLLPDGRMPGMATTAQVARLRAARGRAAEVLWLRLMIPHHRAGVMMAETVMKKSSNPQVLKLASAIRVAQLAEIEQMRKMLAQRGALAKP